MQFVKNGPDVPERLLQAHEEGRVVFFCGAGISRPAGLPDFAGLVCKLYANLDVEPDSEQRMAIDTERFDIAIGLLENRIVGGREKARSELANILTPDPNAPGRTDTHRALLTLSRTRKGETRIVTTNFDRLFEEAITEEAIDVKSFQVPLLPVPKSRWDGIVYLHGRLSAAPSVQELDRLVVSSGDFGLAYLTERWAGRFVTELFRNYTVCFVGYSLDDPVLRYMTDALAADRMLGESPLEMFAFGSHSKGKKADRAGEWRAKNVTPILYQECNHHWYFHETLREWADTYRDGVDGKELIVTQFAGAHPLESTQEDGFVGRVLWALSDPSGLPAKRFADHNPVPSLEWLDPLSDNRYRHTDLNRFGVPPLAKEDNELAFSLIHRPSPYGLAPRMALVDKGVVGSEWDAVMRHLARWLLRHLDDPNLLLWLARRGGRLHREFIGLVERRLEELHKIESNGNMEELRRIRNDAPRVVPRPAMRMLWRLLLAGRIKSLASPSVFTDWKRRFGDGLTVELRLALRDLLTPRIVVGQPIRRDGKDPDESEPIENLVSARIVLSSQDVLSELGSLRESPGWRDALPGLLDDFDALLCDAMDLLRDFGQANEKHDPSYIDRPSIEDHQQNQELFRDWAALIELTRDAWTATAEVAPERARVKAQAWHLARYPVFRRLAFFAAAHPDVISPRRALGWLLADDGWWLWSRNTRRESTRLLVALTRSLDGGQLNELEQAVLAGPPRTMYERNLGIEDWTDFADQEVWWRLAKMSETDALLSGGAKEKFDELTKRHPEWRLQTEDQGEFSFWISDDNEFPAIVATPGRRRDLVEWLKQHSKDGGWGNDSWRQRCKDDFSTTACALCALAQNGRWPADRWIEALHAWLEELEEEPFMIERRWRRMAPVLANAPDGVFQSIAPGVGHCLKSVAKIPDLDDAQFLNLCRRVLTLECQDDADGGIDDPVTRAINHPIGDVTEALLHWWARSRLEDGQRLPDELRPIFTRICDTQIGKFRHGRVLMAFRVITLFRVDHEWTVRHLLPLFDWQRDEVEARAN